MKSLRTFSMTPVAAALCVGLLAIGAGCNRNNGATDTTADTAAGDTATPAGTTTGDASTTPADTTAGNDTMGSGMADDTAGNMSGTAATGTTGTSATDMSGTSDTGSNMGAGAADAMASGPITDTQFYQQAMSGGQKEIAASQMESRQGSSADVKRVADKLISDHTAMGKKVQAAAGSSVTPPPPDTTAPAALEGKSGKDLDRAYVDMMVMDHQKTIALFENAAKNASTEKAKKLAADALPTLREHLKSVQQLQQKTGSM
jgi:putative membrane protein